MFCVIWTRQKQSRICQHAYKLVLLPYMVVVVVQYGVYTVLYCKCSEVSQKWWHPR